jgi:hypothetical protein
MTGLLNLTSVAVNKDAIDVLEKALERVKKGEIASVAVSWVTTDQSIGGDTSEGPNQIMLYASLQHSTNCFYNEYLGDG